MPDPTGVARTPSEGDNALVRKLARFSDFVAGDRLALEDVARSADWIGSGTRIMAEGETGDAIRLLLDGVACAHKDFRDGRRQVIAVLLPGDLCGGHGRLRGPMDHGVRALTRARVATIAADRFAEILDRHPMIAEALHKVALVEQAILRAWIVNLGQRNAYERMAHLFCELTHRMTEAGLTLDNGDFRAPLTQQELGSALGLTSVHVNRILQRLRAEALIDFEHGVLRIHDIGRLQSLADFDPAYLSHG